MRVPDTASATPTLVSGPDGKGGIARGAAGGPTIIAQVAKSLIAVLDWRLSAQQAIALPTIMGWGDQVSVERGTELEEMAPTLRAMGHQVVVRPPHSAEALRKNALGLYVDAVDWSRELEVAPPAAPARPAAPAVPSALEPVPEPGSPGLSPLDPSLGAVPASSPERTNG